MHGGCGGCGSGCDVLPGGEDGEVRNSCDLLGVEMLHRTSDGCLLTCRSIEGEKREKDMCAFPVGQK